MGKRKKGKCAKKNKNAINEPEEITLAPHSFVIHRGIPGGNIFELTKDFRRLMEPFTATSLKERKKNAIKDFVSVSGLLHVSHLCIFTRTELGMYLKIGRLPRGPTLSFKIHNYSLAKDVISSLKKQFVVEEAFKNAPLMVLNSFSGEGLQLKLMTTMFQSMFPAINLTSVNLNNIRRCILLNFDPDTKLIDFRHYAIKVMPVGISKGVKKFVQGKVPNLSNCADIADFLTKSSMMSESEAEDDPNSHVTLSQKMISRGNLESGQSAIRLSELGPRLTLQLIKIEDGLLDGEVLYHELVHKTEEEIAVIQKKRAEKKKIKDKRKKEQSENVRRKETAKQELKEKSLKGMEKTVEGKSLEKDNNEEMVEDDDAEYYRQEVGEEPDKDLFPKRAFGVKRPNKTFHMMKNKRPRFENEASNNRSFKPNRGDKAFKSNRGDKTFKSNRGDKTNSDRRDHRPIGKSVKFSTAKKGKSFGSQKSSKKQAGKSFSTNKMKSRR